MSSKRYFAIKAKRNKNKAKSIKTTECKSQKSIEPIAPKVHKTYCSQNSLDNSTIKTESYKETDNKMLKEMYKNMIKRLEHPYLAEIDLIRKEYSEIDPSKFSESKLIMKQINYLENEINTNIMLNDALYKGKHINRDKYETILNEMNLLNDTLEQMKQQSLRTSVKANNIFNYDLINNIALTLEGVRFTSNNYDSDI